MTDLEAVLIGVVIGPLLGVGLALWVDPLDLSPVTRWPTGGVVAQPTVTVTPPVVAPVPRQVTPTPEAPRSQTARQTAPVSGTSAAAEPTVIVTPTPTATPDEESPPVAADCPEDDVRGEDGECHKGGKEGNTDCKPKPAPQDCKDEQGEPADCPADPDDCVADGGAGT